MSGEFTEKLEMARKLMQYYESRGKEAFLELVAAQISLFVDSPNLPFQQINTQLLSLLSSLLSVLYPCDSSKLTRMQIQIAHGFLEVACPDEKIEIFLRELKNFLEAREKEHEEKSFSQSILLFLSTCSSEEIRDITVERVAEKYAYHPTYLSRKFKMEQGFTPQEAIFKEKMSRAWIFLEKDEAATIKEVSHLLGFMTVDYFSGLFKKHFGFPPNKLRNRSN